MKKFGFTLAEVMVALALIGTITALTIPTFVSSNKNRTHSAKLGVTVSAVENAFSSMIATEARQDLSETRFGTDQTAPNLSQYFKLSGNGQIGNYYDSNNPFRAYNDDTIANYSPIVFEAKNGALLLFENNNVTRDANTVRNAGGTIESSIGRLAIDVNGANPPNIFGRDVFYFRVGNDGSLYPAGSLNFSLLEKGNANHKWNDAGSDYICTNNDKGLGCTARLMENNYEVDY